MSAAKTKSSNPPEPRPKETKPFQAEVKELLEDNAD